MAEQKADHNQYDCCYRMYGCYSRHHLAFGLGVHQPAQPDLLKSISRGLISCLKTQRWYVIHTYSGYENKVANNIETAVENQNLGDLIEEVRVPTEKVLEMRDDGKEREVERKIFPGYVLVKMILTDDSWYVIRNIRGVTGFVGSGSKPIPLSEKEVAGLGVETVHVEVNYAAGDSVRVVSGPLEGFTGVVNAVEPNANMVRLIPFPCLAATMRLNLS